MEDMKSGSEKEENVTKRKKRKMLPRGREG